jgi:hypothetical protein
MYCELTYSDLSINSMNRISGSGEIHNMAFTSLLISFFLGGEDTSNSNFLTLYNGRNGWLSLNSLGITTLFTN